MTPWQEIRDYYITTPEDKAKVKQATQEIYDAFRNYRESLVLDIPEAKKVETPVVNKSIIQRSAHDMVRRILEEWLQHGRNTFDEQDEDDKQILAAMHKIIRYHEDRGLPSVK